MSLIDLFSIATTKGNYLISYIRDGWLTSTIMENISTPRQLMLRWQNYTESQRLNINCITMVERMV